MSLVTLAWIFTLVVVMHNTEEALFLPAWSKSAGRWHVQVGRPEFTFAVVVLTLVLVGFAAAATFAGAGSVWAYLFSGYVCAMVANAFVPHTLGTIFLRRYMPGTATGLLLNLPLGIWFLQRAFAQGFVKWPTIGWVAPAVALAILVSIPALFAVGRLLFGGLDQAPERRGGE